MLAAGVGLLGAFVAVERRVAAPLVELDLFRSRPYLGATAAAFALVGSYWTVMFLLPQYLDLALGFSTARAGVLMLAGHRCRWRCSRRWWAGWRRGWAPARS